MADKEQTGNNSPASSSVPVITLTPTAYQADGALALGSAFQIVGLLGLLGIVLGVVFGVISRFFYLILLFPIVIGGCIGAAGSACIRRFHVRNPLLCGFAGFFAGCLAMFTVQYTGYRIFEKNLVEALGPEGLAVRELALRRDEIRAGWETATEEEKAVIEELETNPEGLEALRTNNVWRYMDLMAHRGVEINSGRGGGGINLGYTGSYIYWAIETLIVAGLAYSLMSKAAAAPYCSDCSRWKEAQLYGPFNDSAEIARAVREGTLSQFPNDPQAGVTDAMITVYTCPNCQHEGTADVLVEKWTTNGKGEVSKKQLTQMTYPGASIPVLATICTPPAPPEAESEVAAVP